MERVKITLWEGRGGSIRDMQECTLPPMAVTLFWILSLNKESCAYELKWEQIKRQGELITGTRNALHYKTRDGNKELGLHSLWFHCVVDYVGPALCHPSIPQHILG